MIRVGQGLTAVFLFLWINDVDSTYPKLVLLRFCRVIFGFKNCSLSYWEERFITMLQIINLMTQNLLKTFQIYRFMWMT